MTGNKRKNRLIFPVVILLLLLALILASAAYMYYSVSVKNAALERALKTGETEISLRRTGAHLREVLASEAEAAAKSEREERAALKDSFLLRDRQSLLTLVNKWNPVSPEYQPRLVELGDGIFIDERAAGQLTEMLKDCFANSGSVPVPISGYRTQEYQQGLYENKIERLMMDGWSETDAPEEAAKSVAVPGTSEHQLGLAIDIIDYNNPNLDITQSWTDTQRWLMQHCSEYGFILRYPDGTTDKTGIIFEPWHYRYVGKAIAREITDSAIIYEDYISSIQ